MWTSAFTRPGGTEAAYQPAGAPLQNLLYAYDLAGNVRTVIELVPGCGVRNNVDADRYGNLRSELVAGDALVREFDYDALYRLTKATGREANNIQSLPPWAAEFHPEGFNWGAPTVPTPGNARDLTRKYVETYTYDPAGNLLKLWRDSNGSQWARHSGMSGFTPREWRDKVQDFLAGGAPNWGVGGNRLTNFGDELNGVTHQFDANGNLIQEFANRLFNWDHNDRLRAFRELDGAGNATKEVRYLYDSAGQRVMKRALIGARVEVTVYVEGLFEHHISGPDQNNTLHVMDNQSRIAMVRVGSALQGDTGPTVQYQLGDHLGSANIVIGGDDSLAGAFRNREEFFPYGETSFGSFTKKRYRFTGKERDEESQLNYHGARYYAPWTTKWVTCDPIGAAGGRNLYAYVSNNPMSATDPSGYATYRITDSIKGTSREVTFPDVPSAQWVGSADSSTVGGVHFSRVDVPPESVPPTEPEPALSPPPLVKAEAPRPKHIEPTKPTIKVAAETKSKENENADAATKGSGVAEQNQKDVTTMCYRKFEHASDAIPFRHCFVWFPNSSDAPPYGTHPTKIDPNKTMTYDNKKTAVPDSLTPYSSIICTKTYTDIDPDCVRKEYLKCDPKSYHINDFNCCSCLTNSIKACGGTIDPSDLPVQNGPGYEGFKDLRRDLQDAKEHPKDVIKRYFDFWKKSVQSK
jgi:RHS repeat-associated protein